MYRFTLIIAILILGSSVCYAQNGTRNSFNGKKTFLSVNSENLRSTHATFFNGASAIVSLKLKQKISLGAGVEYTYADYHFDNGWNLTDLNFLPVFLQEKFEILDCHSFSFYTAARQGISFIHYIKEDPETNGGKPYPVKEKGFYGYVSLGSSLKVSSKISVHAELGLKSYNLSTYDLEVNPHGLNFMAGLSYGLR